MTSTTALYKRIKEDNPAAGNAVADALAVMSLAIIPLAGKDTPTNRLLAHDFASGMDTVLGLFGLPPVPGDVTIHVPEGTPADDRPLYLRLDEIDLAARAARGGLHALIDVIPAIMDPEVRDDYKDVVVKIYSNVFGLPDEAEVLANPDAYPTVGDPFEKIVLREFGKDAA